MKASQGMPQALKEHTGWGVAYFLSSSIAPEAAAPKTIYAARTHGGTIFSSGNAAGDDSLLHSKTTQI